MRATWTLALVSLALASLLAACQQPYRVFAVQVAQAPPPSVTASDPPPPALSALNAAPAAHSPKFHRRSQAHTKPWALNAVPAAILLRLPGIHPATVAAILAGRPYRSKRQLLQRGIVTPAEYARWKAYLVVHRSRGRTR
ncbi:MAG: hypothetical protein ACRD04_09425 [Terriglobales bacterium]